MAAGVRGSAVNVDLESVNQVSIPPHLNATRGTFQLGPFAVDEDRPMRVVVIGAGYSGIVAGIRVPQKIRNVELVIYEKAAGIGGTWFLNKYPGVACDVPAHSYQLSFEPNPHWSSFYAPGHEILAYLKRVAEKYKLMRHIKLKHEITGAAWDTGTGKWNLTIITPDGDLQDAADFVINCTGLLSRWKWPEIPGLHDFKGDVVHSAEWNLEKEGQIEGWKGRNVAVIGVGSSAVQIVPSIQPDASYVVNFVRGKSWMVPPFAWQAFQERSPGAENHTFSPEEHQQFDDPDFYSNFRQKLEAEANAAHGITLRGHPIQLFSVKQCREAMQKKLEKKPWIAHHLIPDYPLFCRRPTPGSAYLEALTKDNVDFVSAEIKCVTSTGIETVDGKHREFDIIICATGFDTSWKSRYPIIGREGITLNEKWDPHPVTYLTMAIDGFPNWFMVGGPNTLVASGSLLVMLEKQVEYAVAALAKLQRERLKSIEVKKEAVKDFDEYLEHYFPQTVFSEKCPSWYKMGKEEGRVVAVWPGSCLHALNALAYPRWEDYNYERLDDHPGFYNRFHWLGNGWTVKERNGGARGWYLDRIDYPPVPT